MVTPVALNTPEVLSAIEYFAREPSETTLAELGRLAWSSAEHFGGLGSSATKAILLATAIAAGLDEVSARATINRVVPGPIEYEASTALEAGPEEMRAQANVQRSSAKVLSRPSAMGRLLVTTTESLPGWDTREVLGIVVGSTIRTRHAGSKFAAGISSTFGGELAGYTRLLTESRDEALDRMAQEAIRLGANGVVGLSFATSDVFDSAAEILAYGTAVRLEKPHDAPAD